ncbi:4Fe-4S dicluster domain-containing protein [Leptolyngbya sp. NK1-12]|uniref:Glycolate oxidase iron-sulfur subunit n=1 Tax=Leptolyngbya sp. NK1-12 TaxID=2547451 RepID=A0AA96WUB1_9CYAN|nr:4Fe-4S dicluster domain-containing protein [Leptolyngbya sp. NK1-12]
MQTQDSSHPTHTTFEDLNLAASSFDAHHPPDPKLIDACVHCGFCLSTCPSYRVIGKETDSPRGRIYLMDAINEGEAPLSTATVQHFDSCLGCLACVTTCPSGVQYDKLIAATRPQIERNYPRSLGDRLFRQLIFSFFPYPERLRVLLAPLMLYQKSGLPQLVRATGLLKRFSPRLAAMETLLPTVTRKSFQDNLPTVVPAQGERRYRVGMILGCVQRLFFSDVNEATARVLSANGCEVVIPKTQGCCAALPHHQGQEAQAQALARQMIDSFAGTDVDAIIINAAGCGHTLKEYGHLLQDDPIYRERGEEFSSKVKDVQEFLMTVGLTAGLSPLQSEPLTLVYQDACHLLHGQKISLQPRQLLRQIPGVTLREPIDAALCCGSAGVYNMLQPEVAEELGQQKVNNLLNTGATLIASANPGCSLQILKHLQLQGKSVSVMHPIQLLDYSIRGVSLNKVVAE